MLILVFNWSGLVPPVGLLRGLRAPTSDLNVTIGLALVAFIVFEIEGFRRLGARGYLSKFFPFYEFKNGIGAGLIAMFVGFIELLLEFIKPVTLSMRLFGNIFGGEVALGVVTGLFVALLPVALYGLEVMLNFVQALIFSTLTLMFISWPSRAISTRRESWERRPCMHWRPWRTHRVCELWIDQPRNGREPTVSVATIGRPSKAHQGD